MSGEHQWFPEDCEKRASHFFSEWTGFYAPYALSVRGSPMGKSDFVILERTAHRSRICACCGLIEQESISTANGKGA